VRGRAERGGPDILDGCGRKLPGQQTEVIAHKAQNGPLDGVRMGLQKVQHSAQVTDVIVQCVHAMLPWKKLPDGVKIDLQIFISESRKSFL
jgi:hypothetical protein